MRGGEKNLDTGDDVRDPIVLREDSRSPQGNWRGCWRGGGVFRRHRQSNERRHLNQGEIKTFEASEHVDAPKLRIGPSFLSGLKCRCEKRRTSAAVGVNHGSVLGLTEGETDE